MLKLISRKVMTTWSESGRGQCVSLQASKFRCIYQLPARLPTGNKFASNFQLLRKVGRRLPFLEKLPFLLSTFSHFASNFQLTPWNQWAEINGGVPPLDSKSSTPCDYCPTCQCPMECRDCDRVENYDDDDYCDYCQGTPCQCWDWSIIFSDLFGVRLVALTFVT